jgi:predicted CoA-binding protein
MNEPDRIRRALETAETVAVVGCSPDPSRASHAISRFLMEQGYRVVPVNPNHPLILGQPAYPSLSDVPAGCLDSWTNAVGGRGPVAEGRSRRVPFFFMQKGVVDSASAARLESAGIGVAMDHCILVEHERLGIAPKPRNSNP